MKQGWTIETISSLCEQMNGIWKGEKEPLTTAKILRTTNFSKDCQMKLDDLAIIEVEQKKMGKRRLKKGDIIVEKSGGGPKQPVGRVILFNIDDDDFSFCNFTSALRIKDQTKILPEFLHKYLTYLYFSGETEKYQSNLVGFRNLDFKGYVSICVKYPSISEQQRIVALLDAEFAKIDALKANAEKNLQNAKDLFQTALKKELEPKEGWNKKQLGEIAEFKNGLNFGKEQGCHKYHFLGVGDFKENTIVETDMLSYIYQDCIDPDYYLKDNDIVFVRSNGSRHLVGRSLLIKSGNEPSVFSGFCIRCRFLSSIVLPQFAMRFFSLDTTKRILTSSGGGCNISNLNQKVLSALEIPFPTSIDEQANIVSRIAQMESHCKNLQANYEKTLSLCDDLKQALLRKAFNGEI